MQYIPMNVIEQAFYGADLDLDENLREKYSGRGMYGKECFGIIHSYASQLIAFMIHLDRIVQEDGPDLGVDFDLALSIADSACSDSMAFDKITYFPGFQIGQDPDDMEDED